MNFKKIAFTLVAATTAVAAMAQSMTTRVFSYDGTNVTNGTVTYIVSGDGNGASIFSGVNAGTVANQNSVTGASATNASFAVNTLVNVSTYVYLSGNFGGVYNVTGIGAGQDVVQAQDIEVRTNRSLTFNASGFYALANNVGTIDYTMSLFQDYPSNGTQIGSTVAGTDAGFTGNIALNASTSLPTDGKADLHLTRKLSLTQAALGGHTYSAAGIIAVSVN